MSNQLKPGQADGRDRIRTPQFVWDHGDETYNADGTSTQVSRLRLLSGRRLPPGMFCKMVTVWGRGSREESVTLIRQARSRYARRTESYGSIVTAGEVALDWAGRVMRERTREGSLDRNTDIDPPLARKLARRRGWL